MDPYYLLLLALIWSRDSGPSGLRQRSEMPRGAAGHSDDNHIPLFCYYLLVPFNYSSGYQCGGTINDEDPLPPDI